MDIKVNKTTVENKFHYINLHGFKDKAERDRLFIKIEQVVKEFRVKTRVF
jgi:hypothetical protein